jgi:hypothetical protein
VLTAQPVALGSLRPSVPPHVAAAIHTAMEKVPADRFATAAELSDALTRQPPERPSARPRIGVRSLAGVAIGVLLLAALWRNAGRRAGLDPNEVVVFPLAITGEPPADSQLGQSVALALSWALNTTNGIRALDGWQLLAAADRDRRRGVDLAEARAIARGRQAGRFVTGSILVGDSTRVMIDLYDAQRGSHLHRSLAIDRAGDPWALGLGAAGDLIRVLVGADAPTDYAVLVGHSLAARERFLQGEHAYRRAHFDEAFEHYREALRADPSFALAALRAAQAARWPPPPSVPSSAYSRWTRTGMRRGWLWARCTRTCFQRARRPTPWPRPRSRTCAGSIRNSRRCCTT